MTMSRKKRRPTNPSPLLYGNTPLPESTTYTHLGIVQSGAGRYPFNPDDVKQVIRGTYFALSSVLSNTGGVNPFTMANLYRTCVLPRALFGLWNKISRPDMMKLEVAHHMFLKHIQSLPHLTRSDMVTGLLGFTSIEAFIDLHKLLFFGTLCSLEPRELSNKLLRLYQFKHSVTETAYGDLYPISSVF